MNEKETGTEFVQNAVSIGDRVWYVPDMCHAYNCNLNNEYPWTIGFRQNPHYEENPDTGERELVEDVLELEEGHLHRVVLPAVHRHPNPKEERIKLVPLRPGKPWPAVVRKVNSDGTLDLDIDSNVGVGMVTLHYDRVPLDENKDTPHTCHRWGAD